MEDLIKKDLRYIWHPYTQMKDCHKFPPILIERSKGAKLYDDKGNFYYDTISSWWCNIHGHNHPEIKKAIKEQIGSLEHVLFAGFTHKGAIRLAERLIGMAPGKLRRVFFSDNGSTAVESALKMSFQYWRNIGRRKKKRFVSLDLGYHGDTIGAMSVSGVGLFNNVFADLLFKSLTVPSPYCYRCPMGRQRSLCSVECVEPLEAILKERGDEIAALILEPIVMAAGGMIVYPAEFLKRAAGAARRYGVHLIADEVATGFGRTGRMFACEHAGIEPDFMCLSKGITSGYLPLGVTLTTEKIYGAFYDDYEKKKTFYHGHTYSANPISCSCALASLDIFEKEKTLGGLKKTIPVFHRYLEAFKDLPIVGDVRYKGMIGALELVKDRKTKAVFKLNERVGMEIYKNGLRRSLILRPLGNVIYLFLPLSIKEREIEYIMDNTYSSIEETNKKFYK